ncbi:uncharacterized protein LOC111346200 [Stylophora pistillata]|uniref:uncharacterized protein LOC111346200 n=1 Tax=Stylophora pistillata TaxID=50429 RepID=UPI000C046B63|nr:uncharacterized protein LOC111346200 [Stylophora pistillata]
MEGLKAKRKRRLSHLDGSSNQALAKKLLTEVWAVYGKKKWRKSTIKAAVHQHWRSIRDDKTKKANNSFERHRRRIKRSNRLKRKLSRRLSTLDNSTVLSDGDKNRAREILSSPDALHYMSSEESCEEEAVEPRGGPTPRKVRKLSWERSKLRNIKVKLDEAYFAALTEKQRRTSARVNRTEDEFSVVFGLFPAADTAADVVIKFKNSTMDNKELFVRVLPTIHVIYERYRFNNRKQEAGESISAYVIELRVIAENCSHNEITPEEILRDRLILGLRDDKCRPTTPQINTVEEVTEEVFCIIQIGCGSRAMITMEVGKPSSQSQVTFQLDTGAECNLLSLKDYRRVTEEVDLKKVYLCSHKFIK